MNFKKYQPVREESYTDCTYQSPRNFKFFHDQSVEAVVILIALYLVLNTEEFEELFKAKGELEDIILMKDPNMPYRNRGFGFVRFKDPACAEAILNSSEEIHLGGKKVNMMEMI